MGVVCFLIVMSWAADTAADSMAAASSVAGNPTVDSFRDRKEHTISQRYLSSAETELMSDLSEIGVRPATPRPLLTLH